MRTLNVILELSKHIIAPKEKSVNTHTYFYKIKRIEVFDDSALIKGIEFLDNIEVLILRKDRESSPSKQFVFHHYINTQCITTKVEFNPNIDIDVYYFFYDSNKVDYIIKHDNKLQWLIHN